MKFSDKQIDELISEVKKKLAPSFDRLDEIALFNQNKVLLAFKNNKIALRHFSGSSGYGYDDEGRNALKAVFADVFHAEAAVVSPNLVSGTHAISLALFAVLKRGMNLLSVSGAPYDTLREIFEGEEDSLKSLGVGIDYIQLSGADFDYDKIKDYILKNRVDMVYVQRSRGYEEREAISVEKIEKLKNALSSCGFDGCIFVDNCYGEFVEEKEPTDVGADIVAGSLIKNPGGGLAPTGGYIAGKRKYMEMCEKRLTAPTIGGEVGSYAFGYQYFFQGLFMAPHVVNQALKGSMLLGAALGELGFETIPKPYATPYDITRSVKMKEKDKLISFVRSVQSVSPVDSFVTCEPWDMPGYEDPVIMAAGCFVQGASIELSADAPIRPPFMAYVQGGLTFEHAAIATKEIIKNLEL